MSAAQHALKLHEAQGHPAKPIEWFVYAKRRGTPTPRPIAGPYPSRARAVAMRAIAHEVGITRHYVSPHSDDVYIGPARGDLAGQVGILNRWLPAPVPSTIPEA